MLQKDPPNNQSEKVKLSHTRFIYRIYKDVQFIRGYIRIQESHVRYIR
jgi:hypothetical protein